MVKKFMVRNLVGVIIDGFEFSKEMEEFVGKTYEFMEDKELVGDWWKIKEEVSTLYGKYFFHISWLKEVKE